jgi:hypothetical protein
MGARSTAEQAGRDSGTTRSATAAAPSAPRAQIVAHTGLRGIAALLVVAYHQQFGDFYSSRSSSRPACSSDPI